MACAGVTPGFRCPTISNIQRIPRAFKYLVAGQLLLVHDGHKEIRSEKQDGPLEPWRRHAKDGEWMLVEPNNAAHHAAIVLKMAVPICVGEHDIRSAVWAMLIGIVEEAAKIRLNAQCVEVVSADFVAPDIGWIFARIQP